MALASQGRGQGQPATAGAHAQSTARLISIIIVVVVVRTLDVRSKLQVYYTVLLITGAMLHSRSLELIYLE